MIEGQEGSCSGDLKEDRDCFITYSEASQTDRGVAVVATIHAQTLDRFSWKCLVVMPCQGSNTVCHNRSDAAGVICICRSNI